MFERRRITALPWAREKGKRMTIEESYATIGDDLDNEAPHPLDCITNWMENLEGASLDELRTIRRALGHDVETSEREFLAMLRGRTGNSAARSAPAHGDKERKTMELTTVFRYEGKVRNRKTKSTACYHDGKPLVMWKVDEKGEWNFDSELNLEKEIGEGLFLVSIVVHKIDAEK